MQRQVRVPGRVSGVSRTREEDMLARNTPETRLDVTRLSEFSAKPENSHGARKVHRTRRYARS